MASGASCIFLLAHATFNKLATLTPLLWSNSRKLRTDGALIPDRPTHWWEFRHEKFLKGRPELLAQIKRANHYESGPAGEVGIQSFRA